MTIDEILEDAAANGVYLYVENKKLKYKVKENGLVGQLLAQLKANKNEIIDRLLQDEKELELVQASTAEIGRIDRSQIKTLPLSFAQQRMFFLNQFLEASSIYNMPLAIRIRGDIDELALVQSLEEIVNRHESLRSKFEANGESAIQTISSKPANIEVEDVFSESEIRSICELERNYKFNLSSDDLCRIRLLLDRSQEEGEHGNYVLLVTMHHIVSDGWSLGIFFKELVDIYSAFKDKKTSPLPPLSIQYVDYAHWQRERLKGDLLQNQLNYWKYQLADLPPLINLPTDRPRPPEQTYNGRSEQLILPLELSTKLQKISSRYGVTLYMTLISAFSILLSRYSGQTDVAIGTPIANRNKEEIEGLIGFFVNTLVIRNDLEGSQSYVDLLKRTRETALQAYSHQDIPFEQVVEILNLERNNSYSPLFQVMFSLQNTPVKTVYLPSVEFSPVIFKDKIEDNISRFDLVLNMEDTPEGIFGNLEYNTDLFDQTTIQRMLVQFESLLQQIVSKPQNTISSFDIFTASERQQLISKLNVKNEFTYEKCLTKIFESKVSEKCNFIALECEGESISYRALNDASNRVAHEILKSEANSGTNVVVCLERTIDTLIAILGVLKSGCCVVPVDPDASVFRINRIIEETSAQILLTDQKLMEKKASINITLSLIDWTIQSNTNKENPAVLLRESDLACILYHESACGELVGACYNHNNIIQQLLFGGMDITSNRSCLIGLPKSNRLVVFEIMSRLLVADKKTTIKPYLRNYHQIFPNKADDTKERNIGLPAVNNGVVILDQDGELANYGTVGELYIQSENSAQWYVSNARLTARDFIPNRWSDTPGARLWRTGLCARFLNDGNLSVISLMSFKKERLQHKTGTQLLKKALLELDYLKDSEIIIEALGHNQRLVTYVVPENENFKEDELVNEIRKAIKHQSCLIVQPYAIKCVSCLPKDESGKLDKKRLPQINFSRQEPYVAPVTELEKFLVNLWQEKLMLTNVGIDDNYFSLGGDSIRSIGLVADAKNQGVHFTIKDLFSNPTIRKLSAIVKENDIPGIPENIEPFSLLTKDEFDSIQKIDEFKNIDDAFPLSMMQQGMVLLSLKHRALNLYENLQIYHFKSIWDYEIFTQALDFLLTKHSMLRSVCCLSLGRPLQLIYKNKSPNLNVVDLSEFNQSSIKNTIERWMADEKAAGLNTEFEMWRATVHVLPNKQFVFGMFLHHALWDGWSLESFATELTEIYNHLKVNAKLPDYEILPSYNQFIALEKAAIASEENRDYWKKKLSNANLPWWTGQKKSLSENVSCEISLSSSQKLIALSQSLGVQEKSLWSAIYLALLSILNGSNKIVGTVLTQGRPEIPGGDKMVGVFINAQPVSADLNNTSWKEFIVTIDKELREQHGLRNYPLAEIQRLNNLDFSGAILNYTNWHVYYEGVEGDKRHRKEEKINLDDAYENFETPLKVGGWAETDYLFLVEAFKDERTRRFGVNVSADSKIFDKDCRDRIAKYIKNIVCQLENSPEAMIEKSMLLGDFEKNELLVNWNDTVTDFQRDICIHQLFEKQAYETPDSIALNYDSEQLTYRELNKRANQLAHCLISRGVCNETLIGICLERSLEMVIAIIAILKAGGGYVPLDPNYPTNRLTYLIENSGISTIVTKTSTQLSLGSSHYNRESKINLLFENLDWINEFSGLSAFSSDNPNVDISARNLAYVIYTSGSTGLPKGVRITHRNAINFLQSMQYQPYISANDRVLAVTTLSFDIALLELILPLIVGATTDIASNECVISGDKISARVESNQITLLQATPITWKLMLESNWRGNPKLTALVGGEAFPPALAQTLLKIVKNVWNMYGPTETTVWSTIHNYDSASKKVAIGKPIGNTNIYILNEQQEICAIGAPGELYIGGEGVSQGYFKRSALTAERFLPNPFSTVGGARIYRTGDLVRYLFDGNVEHLGRIDFQVKVRGFRIELGEIEAVLQQHNELKDVVVVIRKDNPENIKIVAYAVQHSGKKSLDDISPNYFVTELRNLAQSQLPNYMIPSNIIVLESLPLTDNGKIDRNSLPEPDDSDQKNHYVEAEGLTESLLANIWSDVLNCGRVGRLDNFFELGGHSLLATQLLARIRRLFSIEIDISILFENQTLQTQAQKIDELKRGKSVKTIALEKSRRDINLPLSYAQQRLLFLSDYMGPNSVYNIPLAIKLNGATDTSVLLASLQEIISRHESLRTRFIVNKDCAYQYIEEALPKLTLEFVDNEESVRIISQQEQNFHFDMRKDILCRIRIVFNRQDNYYALFVTMHHSISDGWSLGVFFKELIQLYTAFKEGESSPLKALPIQYADYAKWQRLWLAGGVLEKQLDYWREQLQDLPPLLTLPTDRERPTEQTFKGSTEAIYLPASITSQLQALSKSHGSTLYMCLLSAFSILLSRYANQADLAIGTPIANRSREETESIIGFFVNTLVIRINLSEKQNFLQLLEQTRKVALQAYTNQDVPFEQLVEELNPERSLSHSPLFQVMFALQNIPIKNASINELDLTPLKFVDDESTTQATGVSRYDLWLTLHEVDGGISGGMEYNSDLFDRITINRMLKHYQCLLESIIENPNMPISRLQILSPDEIHQQLNLWNLNSTDYPENDCVHELFESKVHDVPDATALICEDYVVSYAELNRRSNRLARYLISKGVGPEVLVGIYIDRSIEMIVAILAIMKAGGAYVPFDTGNPSERLKYLVKDSKVHIILTQTDLANTLSQLDCQLILLDQKSLQLIVKEFSEKNINVDSVGVTSRNISYLIYTSGSTGKPKGVMGLHQSIVNRLVWFKKFIKIDEKDVLCQKTSLAFVDHVAEIFQALTSGVPLVIIGQEVARTPALLIEQVNEREVSKITLVPSLLNSMLMDSNVMMAPKLKDIFCSGEMLRLSGDYDFNQRFPNAKLFNIYGSTEIGADVTACRVEDENSLDSKKYSSNIGKAISNIETFIFDNDLNMVPVGVIGELYVGGDGLARGYWRNAKITAEKYIPNPHSKTPGMRLYRTGDLVRYLPDGNIDCVGRTDQQIKIRGFRIELGEVEGAITKYTTIKSVVVLAKRDQTNSLRLVAYVIFNESKMDDGWKVEVKAALKKVLPDYMVPSVYVSLEHFPVNTSGKIDRKSFPELDVSALRSEYVSPLEGTETLLASLWSSLLNIERVGRFDNFFELGGHSLLATQLLSRIKDEFSVELTIRTLFEQQTIPAQARLIDTTQKSTKLEDFPLVKVKSSEPKLLSYSQQRLWFLSKYTGPNAVYNMPLALRLDGKLNVVALKDSLREIVSRHEILRTRFVAIDENAIQVVEPYLEILETEEVEFESQLAAICNVERNYKFNLTKDLLCRIRLVYVQESNSHALFVTMHHTISDGWSLGIFFSELVEIYQAFNSKKTSPLLPLKIQYSDYSSWQRNWLQGQRLEAQLSYWRDQLKNIPTLLKLPTDRPRPLEQTFNGSTMPLNLSKEMTNQLLELSQKQNCSLFMTLLSAFSILLSRYTNQNDIAIGTPIANRTRFELESMIGFFVNTLVMRTIINNNFSFLDILKTTREMALEAYAHQDLPFEQLVEELSPDRSLSHSPLFQVMFALQNMPMEEVSLPELEISPLVLNDSELDISDKVKGVSRFDLTLNLQETPAGIAGVMEFNTDLFDKDTIVRMLTHFKQLLSVIVDSPKSSISSYKYLTELEEQQIIANWRPSNADYSKNQLLHETIDSFAEQKPYAVALSCGNNSINYQELLTRANGVTNYILSTDIMKNARVGVFVEDSIDQIAFILGVLKAGCCFYIIEKNTPTLKLDYLIEQYNLSLIFSSNIKNINSAYRNRVISINDIIISKLSISTDLLSITPQNAACIIPDGRFDEDSNGLIYSHQNLNCLFSSDCEDFSSPKSVLCGFNNKNNVIYLNVLRELFKGSEDIDIDSIQSIISRDRFIEDKTRNIVSLSQPIANAGCFILDSNGHIVAPGVVGEVYIDGDVLAQGYSNSKKLTAKYFIPHAWSSNTGSRMYRTGRLARYVKNNCIELYENTTFQVVSENNSHRLTDLESFLIELQQILDVASILKRSNGSSQIATYLVVSKDTEIDKNSLKTMLIKKISNEKYFLNIPNHFVFLEALPVKSNGRLDISALPNPGSTLFGNYTAASTNTEALLVKIWQDSLGLQKVGINDNYFVLGGDSIRSIALVAEAKKDGLNFEIKDLFAHPTIEELAFQIDEGNLGVSESVEIEPYALLLEDEQEKMLSKYGRHNLEDAFPLSMMQQGMVLLTLKQNRLNLYENIQLYHFDESWEHEFFIEALEYLLCKHPLLRSVCDMSFGRPIQIVLKNRESNLSVVDISTQAESSVPIILDNWAESEKTAGIDVGFELWRGTVHILPNNQFVFGMFLHHVLWDGWSLESFATELTSCYSILKNHGSLNKPEKLPSYSQFIALEQAAISSDRQQAYWLDKLADIKLPWWTGKEKSKAADVFCEFSSEICRGISELANRLNVQEKSIWCTVYLTLLSILDGSDYITGPVATQGRPEIPNGDKMVGVFINALPISIDTSNKAWKDLIQDTDKELREQHAFRHYPLPEIQRLTGLDYSASLFNYTNWHVYYEDNQSSNLNQNGNDLEVSAVAPKKVGGFSETNYLLLFYAFKNEKTQQFGVNISLDSAIFNTDFRSRISGYVQNIISQLLYSTNESIEKTLLLGREEIDKLITGWNAPVNHENELCVHQLFEKQAANSPNSIAIVYTQENECLQLTYEELNRRSNQIAHYLVSKGVGPDVQVGVCVERTPSMVIGILAILKAGGCYVPIDTDNPQSRIKKIISQSNCRFILGDKCLVEEIAFKEELNFRIQEIDISNLNFFNYPECNVSVQTNLYKSNLAYVIYTSGSTGEPKGVSISHENITSLVAVKNTVEISKNAVVGQLSSYAFDAITYEMWGALLNGSRLVIVDKQTSLQPAKLKEVIAGQKLTTIFITTALFNRICYEIPDCFNSLDKLSFGGEAYSADAIDIALKSKPKHLYHVYGPTEATTFATSYELEANQFSKNRIAPIGSPLTNKKTFVLQENNLCPVGVGGELCIGGIGVARGYLNRPALTAEKFVPNPYSETAGERIYRTGDLVRYLEDGNLDFIGRIDHQVKVRGFRIELGEIENVLLTHEMIKEAIVIVREDRPNDKRIVSYLVCHDNDKDLIDKRNNFRQQLGNDLRMLAEKELPNYMVPLTYTILDSMPLNTNGKVDRSALPVPEFLSADDRYISPEGFTEELLANVWSNLLGRPLVGRYDNFFEIGGHSLLATQLASHIRDVFAVEIPIRSIFEKPSLIEQASIVEKAKAGQEFVVLPFSPAPKDAPKLLSFAQQRLWFINQFIGANSVYNIPLSIRLSGNIDLKALTKSLTEIVKRHEALRTRFKSFEDSAIQVIDEQDIAILIEEVESTKDLKTIYKMESQYKFDLTLDNLCRIRVVRVQSDSSIGLFVTMHHIVSDGWSLGVFFRELITLYRAFSEGNPSPLVPLAVQYADYSYWQRNWLKDDVLEAQQNYWLEQLKELPKVLDLPTDRPRPEEQTFNGSSEGISLSKELSTRVIQLARQENVTLYMFLLSAFSILMARYANVNDVAIGTPIANRNRKETESLIGFFVNTLVMRLQLNGAPRFVDLLKQVREVTLQGYSHQDIPFEQLVEVLSPDRNLKYSPLFQVMFALQNMPLESVDIPGLDINPMFFEQDIDSSIENKVSRYDLTFSIQESAQGIVGSMEYNTDLFDRSTIQNMLLHYQRLLEAIVQSPTIRISEYEFLTQEERYRQLALEQERSALVNENIALHQLFELKAFESPDSVALIEKTKTYRFSELNSRANKISHELIRRGVTLGKSIGILASSLEAKIVSCLAVLKVGACCVCLEPKTPAFRLANYIEENDLEVIVAETSLSEIVGLTRLFSDKIFTNQEVVVQYVDYFEIANRTEDNLNPTVTINMSQPAFIAEYGVFDRLPGMICLTHTNMMRFTHLAVQNATDSSHDIEPLEQNTWLSLELAVFNGLNLLNCWNNMMISPRKEISRVGIEIADSELVASDEMSQSFIISQDANCRYYILDEYGSLMVNGAEGDLYVDSEQIALSYNNHPGLTAKKFIPNSFSLTGGERLFHSGCKGKYLPNGEIRISRYLRTKNKTLCKASEINALNSEIIKLGNVEDSITIKYESELLSYVACRDESNGYNIGSKIRKNLSKLPNLIRMPGKVMVLQSLPRTSSGIIDRKKLPIPSALNAVVTYVAAKTEIQKALVDLWQRKLGRDRVGINDNYFVLGGDSIRSISLIADGNKIGLNFSVRDLFANPTIAELAICIENNSNEASETTEVEVFSLLTNKERELLINQYGEELEDAFPLSMMQQGMVLLSLKERHLNLYENIQVYHFSDSWNESTFESALSYLLNKHPMLRSKCHLSAGRPILLQMKNLNPKIEVNDLTMTDKNTIENQINTWVESEKAEGIDTSVEMWRITIHILPGGGFLFGMCVHHAMWDGWSLESFATELYATYSQVSTHGKIHNIDKLPSYSHFIAQEQKAIDSSEQQSYWLNKLVDAKLPWWTGSKKSPAALISYQLPRESSSKLSKLAHQLGIQEKSIWCAAYLVLLALLDGNEDITGPVATQGRPEISGGEKMIGVFLNALPLRGNIKDKSWSDFIVEIDLELREQHGYRHFPLAEIQRLTGMEFSGSLFNYTNWHVYYENDNEDKFIEDAVETKDDRLNPVNTTPHKVGGFSDTNYLMLFDAFKDEKSQQFGVKISLDSEVFNDDFRRRIFGYLNNIVEQINTNLNSLINKQMLIGETERKKLLETWNCKVDNASSELLVHEMFESQVSKAPDAIALVYRDSQLSFGELSRRSNKLANYLISLGVGPEIKVGICCERNFEMLIGILAILKSGGAYVPIDPGNPKDRIGYILKDSEVNIMLTHSELPLLEYLSQQNDNILLVAIDRCNVINSSRKETDSLNLSAEKVASFKSRQKHDDLAYVIYTSGSTGNPKGVLVEHKNVSRLFNITESQFEFGCDDRWTLFHSFAFDFSVWEIWGSLIYGGCLIIVPERTAQSPGDFYHLLANQKVTVLNQTPTMFNQVIKVDGEERLKLNLRTIVFGGEALDLQNLKPWFQRHDENAIKHVNMYGITETTVHVTYRRIYMEDINNQSKSLIGKKLGDLELYLLDNNQNIVPIGVPGEMYVGGEGVTRGYLNRQELTKERFIINPLKNGRLYRTGDLARFLDNGDVEYMGRLDHQVKIRGFRIELGEIENVILRNGQVEDVAVLLQTTPHGDKRLIAYIVSSSEKNDVVSETSETQLNSNRMEDELRMYLQAHLPEYMIPSVFMMLSSLPLTNNGKLDRNALLRMEILTQQSEYIEPRNEVESMLCQYWQELFEVDRVGVHDSFWALGGHSLLAIRVSNFIKDEFEVELPMKTIFGLQNVEDFANFVLVSRDIKLLRISHPDISEELDTDDIEEGSF